jgi:Na+-translocating ferredoxin:NAD+ oxidoreductase RnfD subunit
MDQSESFLASWCAVALMQMQFGGRIINLFHNLHFKNILQISWEIDGALLLMQMQFGGRIINLFHNLHFRNISQISWEIGGALVLTQIGFWGKNQKSVSQVAFQKHLTNQVGSWIQDP